MELDPIAMFIKHLDAEIGKVLIQANAISLDRHSVGWAWWGEGPFPVLYNSVTMTKEFCTRYIDWRNAC